MRYHQCLAVVAALCLIAPLAQAKAGQGHGRCKDGFEHDTLVRTESRGNITMDEVQAHDRVWSFNEIVGKPGWSTVQRREDGPVFYRLISDFSDPDSGAVTRACWRIRNPA